VPRHLPNEPALERLVDAIDAATALHAAARDLVESIERILHGRLTITLANPRDAECVARMLHDRARAIAIDLMLACEPDRDRRSVVVRFEQEIKLSVETLEDVAAHWF